jgi:alpha-1,3-rhamnosyl/mannosyltransferase
VAVNVLLDARKLGDGGIGTYLESLIEGILLLTAEGEADVLLSLLVEPGFRKVAAAERLEAWHEVLLLIPEPANKYSLSEYLRLAGRHRLRIECSDLFHTPHYTLPFFLGIPSVATIHDAIHVSHPERILHRSLGAQLIRSAASRADSLITVSEHSRQTLATFGLLKKSEINVIPNAVPAGFVPMDRPQVEDFLEARNLLTPYCVYIGSDRPHKGFAELLSAWKILGPNAPTLLVIGKRFGAKARSYPAALGIADRVRFEGEISRREIVAFLCGAQAAIVPSREEGFGLPALEAMACGTPVVCSPHPALQEVCAGSAWYSRSFDASDLAAAIEQMDSRPQDAASRIASGKLRAQSLNIREVARQTLRVYEKTLHAAGVNKRALLSGAGYPKAAGGIA